MTKIRKISLVHSEHYFRISFSAFFYICKERSTLLNFSNRTGADIYKNISRCAQYNCSFDVLVRVSEQSCNEKNEMCFYASKPPILTNRNGFTLISLEILLLLTLRYCSYVHHWLVRLWLSLIDPIYVY